MELEKECQKKKELKTQIENLTNAKIIIKLNCEEDGRMIERTFVIYKIIKFRFMYLKQKF